MSIFISASEKYNESLSRELVPPGEYEATIAEITEIEGKYVLFVFKLIDPETPFHGQLLKNFYGMHEFGFKMLVKDCQALGFPDSAPLHDSQIRNSQLGRYVRIQIRHSQKNDKIYANCRILSAMPAATNCNNGGYDDTADYDPFEDGDWSY